MLTAVTFKDQDQDCFEEKKHPEYKLPVQIHSNRQQAKPWRPLEAPPGLPLSKYKQWHCRVNGKLIEHPIDIWYRGDYETVAETSTNEVA